LQIICYQYPFTADSVNIWNHVFKISAHWCCLAVAGRPRIPLYLITNDQEYTTMPHRTVLRDLKAPIPILHHEQGLSVKKICELLGIRKSLVYQTLIYSRTFGVHYNPHTLRQGRRRTLLPTDHDFICSLLERCHCTYLVEIQEALAIERGVCVSIPTVLQTLCRLHFSRKCVSVHALERNDLLRSAFMNRIAEDAPDPEMLMFIDEAARNRLTSGRKWGWSLVGKRCVQRRHFV
jgi:transposase